MEQKHLNDKIISTLVKVSGGKFILTLQLCAQSVFQATNCFIVHWSKHPFVMLPDCHTKVEMYVLMS